MEENKKISTDFLIYIFLHYIIFVWLNDYINLAILFLGLEQDNLVGNLLVILLIGIIISWDHKKFLFEKFDKKCLIGIFFIITYSLYCFVYADISYDAMEYHVMNQNPVWYGKENLVLWETYFPLPDRLMYLFRYLFGYRIGTLFNSFILIITYTQVVRLLKLVFVNEKKKFFNPYILAFASIMIEAVLMDLGTYLTDLVGIPLVIELVICIVSVEDEGVDITQMLYFVTCMAYMFLMKLTGIIYVVPILLIYLYRIYKNTPVYNFLI